MHNLKLDIKIRLAALWASLVFCFLYGDYIGLYRPGQLQSMLGGRMGPLGEVNQGLLVGVAILMAIPSLMVCLSVILHAAANKWLNIGFGLVFVVIMLMTMPGAWHYYLVLGVIEIALCLTIVWTAWRWPAAAERQSGST